MYRNAVTCANIHIIWTEYATGSGNFTFTFTFYIIGHIIFNNRSNLKCA